MSIRALLSAASSNYLSIINKVDIFNDNSGKVLYRFEDNALDDSGNYNGTADGTVTYTTGKFGRGKVCDQTALRRISSTYTLAINSSLSFWVRRDGTASDQVVFAMGTPHFIAVNYSDQWIGNSPIAFVATDASVMCPVVGTWYHIVFTDDGTAIKGYRNNVLVPNAAAYSPLYTWAFNYIGGYPTMGANLQGVLDQVRIFNRALTAGEVSTLYTEI